MSSQTPISAEQRVRDRQARECARLLARQDAQRSRDFREQKRELDRIKDKEAELRKAAEQAGRFEEPPRLTQI